MKWKIGDKVQLNSGSPEMTVNGFSPRGTVWVEWEYEPGQWTPPRIEERAFPPECLEPYGDTSGAEGYVKLGHTVYQREEK